MLEELAENIVTITQDYHSDYIEGFVRFHNAQKL